MRRPGYSPSRDFQRRMTEAVARMDLDLRRVAERIRRNIAALRPLDEAMPEVAERISVRKYEARIRNEHRLGREFVAAEVARVRRELGLPDTREESK